MSEKSEHLKTNLKNMVDSDAEQLQSEGRDAESEGTPDNPSHRVLTLANLITFCRLALTIAFLLMFATGKDRYVALTFYAIAALTDFLDGKVARATHTVSWVGKIMDPIMDRVLLFAGVLGLMLTGELPPWIAAFVIARDAYLAWGAWFLQRYRRRPVDVVYVGKVTTALLMAGFCDLLLDLPVVNGLGITTASWLPGLNSTPSAIGIFFVYAGLVCSTVTTIIYTRKGFAIRDAWRAKQEATRGE